MSTDWNSTQDDPLFRWLQPDRCTVVVDVGANPIDGEPPYKPLLDRKLCSVIGFEPQESALAVLNQRKGPLETYLPYAVGDGNEHTLYLCEAQGMNSLLRPDARMLSCFNLFPELGQVIGEQTITTRRLDDIAEIECLDFLKIDVQGSELSVFQSGRHKIREAIAIQTEVSFLPLYENQPLFGEIDSELRSQGFIPHTFPAIKCWPIAPLLVNNDPRQSLNQLLEADVVYFRDFTHPEPMSNEQLKHLILIAHYCYGSFDIALRCLLILEERGVIEPNTYQSYLQLITNPIT